MTYLTFLTDNYDNIPKAGVVFIHGSRFAWHNDHKEYDNIRLLEDLDIPAALEGSEYSNLRCDWSLSTCPQNTKSQGGMENSIQAVLGPYDDRVVSDAMFPGALVSIFGNWEKGVEMEMARLGSSDVLKSQCCAQFVVSRDSIHQHSREEYVKLRQWLLDAGRDAAPENDKHAGRILSYMWHILFIRREKVEADKSGREVFEGWGGLSLKKLNREACPSAEDCYCRLYGRCGLKGCEKGSCKGQYRLPKDLTLPENWQPPQP